MAPCARSHDPRRRCAMQPRTQHVVWTPVPARLPDPAAEADRAHATGSTDATSSRGALSYAHCGARLPVPAAVARRHRALRPDHRRDGQQGHPTLFARWPDATALAGANREEMEVVLKADRLLPRQDGSRCCACRLTSSSASTASCPGASKDLVTLHGVGGRPPMWCSATHSGCRPDRRHALRAAGATLRVDRGDRPCQGRGSGRRPAAAQGLDSGLAS